MKRFVVVNLHHVSSSHQVLAAGVAYTNGYVPAHGELAHVERNLALEIKFRPGCLIK
jgi:Mn-containing catalase